jgi:hypothetical protein
MTGPRTFHFVFGLKAQNAPFHLAHYLALASCIRHHDDARVVMHHGEVPYGPWWDRIRPHLELCPVGRVDWLDDHPGYFAHEEGRLIVGADFDYAHHADVIRLEVLAAEGGIYADIDTLFVDEVPLSYDDEPFVIGEEDVGARRRSPRRSLCNAFMVATPGSHFALRWLDRIREVFDGTWSRHSCTEAALLAAEMPDEVSVLSTRPHCAFPATASGLGDLFERRVEVPDGVVSIHWWEHLWWSPRRRDFTSFHNAMLTEEYVLGADTTFARLARPTLLDPP